ncbi:MAG: serine/threonine protein kinase [Planctomycetota bacterium]|nr:MAG: serine/threonine protein kinase [Planctomycetota bacterium]
MNDDAVPLDPTIRLSPDEIRRIAEGSLQDQFLALQHASHVRWTTEYRLLRRLGSGGQGIVFLAERLGAHGLTLRVALKFFSPAEFPDAESYRSEMARIARVAMRLASVQQDHLLDVQNIVEVDGIQVMVMEWVDGFDLRKLLDNSRFETLRTRTAAARWEYINDVIATAGPQQVRLKPGIAVAILRDCLAALDAMYSHGILHGDIKPANIMIKRTGITKLVDFGSSFDPREKPRRPAWTPLYAPLELMEGGQYTQRSELASLGYVLIEMLAGAPIFERNGTLDAIREAKRTLPRRMRSLLPPEVRRNGLLMEMIQRLTDPEPQRRFPSAQDAELTEAGAAAFHRQLVLSDLASEYRHEIRHWLELLS